MWMLIKNPQRKRLRHFSIWLSAAISVFTVNFWSAHAQNLPPSRPILFVHGFCGDAGSWSNLAQALSTSMAKDHADLYPYVDANHNQIVYKVYYDSNADQVVFVDPASGQTVSEMWILPSARFFEMAFYDSDNATFDPTDVANISVLNKAYELSRVVKEITKITRIEDVIVVAHSMGGLVARAYMENLASPGYCWDPGYPSEPDYTGSQCTPGRTSWKYTNDIADLITIDTPHGGTLASTDSISYPLLACALQPSTTKSEMIPGSSFLQALNYYGDPARQLPSAAVPPTPLQSIASFFANEPNPLNCPDKPTTNDGLTFYCDDLISSSHQAVRQNLETNHRAQLPNWTDLGNSFNDQDQNIEQDAADCWVPIINSNVASFRMLHFIQCLGHQPQTQSTVYNQINPIVSGLLTSITVQATYNGQPWRHALSYTILSQDYSSRAESVVPLTLSGVEVGSYSIPLYDVSGGPAGTSTPTVTASPNATIQPGQWGITFTIAFTDRGASTTSISASSLQLTQGASVTFSAKVQSGSQIPTGTVVFYDGATDLSSAIALNASGTALFSTSALSSGPHSITARYSGDGNFAPSTSTPVTVTVGGISPHISVSPQNGTIGVTAFAKSGTGFTPNGSITHTASWPNGTKSILKGYADATGGFSYTVTYSSVTGTYYQTDTDDTTGVQSNTASWTVSPAIINDFSATASPSSQTVLQSGSVSYNVATATTSGSAQTVGLSISGLPTGLTASFSPTTVTTGGQSTLTISASSSVPVGTYTLMIAAASLSITHTYQVSVTVAQAQTGPLMTVTPSIVRFNDQTVGSISSPQTVILRNSGTGQLIVTGVGLASGNADYALDLSKFSSPLILNQGVTFTVPVYFEPTAGGSRPGQIIIYDNAPGSPQVVSLTGNGLSSQPTTGTITVNATLNGIALPALYGFQYSVSGPTQITGYDSNSFSVVPGSYSITFLGTPSYFTLSSISTSATQSVVAGGTTTFTLNFAAPNDFYGPTFMQPPSGGFTPQVVPAGSTATYYVDVAEVPNSASTPITLAVVGVPNSSSPVFNPQPMYSGTGGTLNIGTTAGQTPSGVYALTLSGTNSSGVKHAGNTSTLAVTSPPTLPVRLISQSNSGVQGNSGGFVTGNSMSGDGRFVTFSSTSTNLVSGVTSAHQQIYVRDVQNGTTSLVSVSTGGTPADSDNYGGSMSANGQFVVFYSFADNLYPGSALNSASGVYVRDLTQNVTEREDVAPDGTPANGTTHGAAISADGRFVTFISSATNLINGVSGTQLYVRDRKSAKTALVSAAIDGSPANGSISSDSISADGRFVAFISNATNLVSQNTSGLFQAFVRDVFTGGTDLVSISPAGIPANSYVFDDNGSAPPGMSSDGRYIAFSSYATNLVPQPTDGTNFHNFIFDRQTQQISLVDVDSVGTPLNGTGYLHPSISPDGRFVGFYGFGQVLVRDTVENQTAVVSLGSNGQAGNNTTWGWNIGLGGASVAFASTATNLIANDSNNTVDAFAASNPFVGSTSLKSISVAAPSTSGGGTVTGTVALTAAAPANGAVVSVWSNNAAVQPPALVTVPAGSTSAQFSINTSVVTSETITTVMAAYNGGSGVSVLTLQPASELTVSPTSFDFGNQLVAATSPAQPFTLTNSGTAALTINSIQMSTGQAFNIIANTCQSSLSPGDSCSLAVTFKPLLSGSVSDSVQISTGTPANIQAVTVTGDGAIGSAVLSPSTLSFGNQWMPGTRTANMALTNTGSGPLSGISVSISGTNNSDFSVSSDGCTGVILPANSTCLITVAFAPKAMGTRAAILSVADSASDSPQIAALTGIGVQSTPIILWNPSSTSIAYGTALGAGILNATATSGGNTLLGTFAYSAKVSGGSPLAVTSASVLPAGTYTLTAAFTPTDTVNYTNAVVSVILVVNPPTAINLSISPSTLTSGGTVTLSAVVTSAGLPVNVGQVQFCDATAAHCTDIHLLGTSQLTNSGIAILKFRPGIGNHSYKAVFVGTPSHASSVSSNSTLAVTPKAALSTNTTIGLSGSSGNYTLTAAVTGNQAISPTGTVAFLDTSAGNTVLASSQLGPSTSSLTWTPPPNLPAGAMPSAVAVADFNGDGIPDLAVSNGNDNTVTILLGQGDGTFSSAPSWHSGGGQIVAADLNSDGNTDLVLADSNIPNLEILLGNGDGTFAPAQSLALSGVPAGVVVGDFNEDGIPDLVVTNYNDNSVALLLGDGTGGFTRATSNVSAGRGALQIASSDFNGDGHLDIAVTNSQDNTVSVFLGDGKANLSPVGAVVNTNSTPTKIVAADFDGDGKADLAVINLNAESISVFLGNGDGTFKPSAVLATIQWPYGLAVGDINADGKADLIATNGLDNYALVYAGNGDGTFTDVGQSATGVEPTALAIGDFNGDGIPDIAAPFGNLGSGLGGVTILLTQLRETATATVGAISPLGTGTHQVEASYEGDTNYSASTSSAVGLSAELGVPVVTVTPSVSSLTTAQSLSVTVTVSSGIGKPTPTGTVLLSGGGYTSTSVTLSGGTASFSISAGILASGSDNLTATYSPDANSSTIFSSASGSATVTVTPPAKTTPTVTVTPSSNSITTTQSLTVTVSVSGGSSTPTPTGTVKLFGGGYTSAASILSGGSATISIPANSLSAGTDSLVVSYTPDSASSSTYNSASGSATVTVTTPAKIKPTVTVTPSSNSITTTQPLTVTISVNGGSGNPTPTGTVTLSGGGYISAASILSGGSATINIPANSLSAGTDSLAVSYTPDSSSSSTYSSASGLATVTVTTPAKIMPTVTVTPSSNSITTTQPLTVTVSVNGGSGNPTPTGTVTLSSGSYSSQQTLSVGTANFTIAAGTLANGANTLTASYSGDPTYSVANSTGTVIVEPVSMSATLPAQVNPGHSTTSTVTLTGSHGYSGTMKLICSLKSSPAGALSLPTCGLNPTNVVLPVDGNGTSTLTVNTTAASTTASARPTDRQLWKLGGGAVLAALLFLGGIPSQRRRWSSWMLLLLIATAGAIACGGGGGASSSGAGGGSGTPATTAGTYSFAVTGTDSVDANITVSTTVSVAVQ